MAYMVSADGRGAGGGLWGGRPGDAGLWGAGLWGAGLWWTGEFGGAPGPWRATDEALAAGSAACAGLPPGTLPLEQLQVIVPALAATDPLRLHLDPPAVVAAAKAMIAGMVDCLPAA